MADGEDDAASLNFGPEFPVDQVECLSDAEVATILEGIVRQRGDAQMLRQILVDAPRTCPGSPLFAHDRVQALVVNVLYVWAVRHSA